MQGYTQQTGHNSYTRRTYHPPSFSGVTVLSFLDIIIKDTETLLLLQRGNGGGSTCGGSNFSLRALLCDVEFLAAAMVFGVIALTCAFPLLWFNEGWAVTQAR